MSDKPGLVDMAIRLMNNIVVLICLMGKQILGGNLNYTLNHCMANFLWNSCLSKTVFQVDLIKWHYYIYYYNIINHNYSRTSLFRTRLIRSPCYFDGRSNALGFTLPLYASPLFRSAAISNFFPFPLGLRNSRVRLYKKISNLISALIGQYASSLCNWTVCAITYT